jgi:hypothetical protein
MHGLWWVAATSLVGGYAQAPLFLPCARSARLTLSVPLGSPDVHAAGIGISKLQERHPTLSNSPLVIPYPEPSNEDVERLLASIARWLADVAEESDDE